MITITVPRTGGYDKERRIQVEADEAKVVYETADPRWISVEERLPGLDQDVLIYAIGKEGNFKNCTHIVVSQRYTFHIFSGDSGVEEWLAPWPYFNLNYKVTHWMPLPEPPEEE